MIWTFIDVVILVIWIVCEQLTNEKTFYFPAGTQYQITNQD